VRHARQYERWEHLVTEKLVASGSLNMDFRNLTRAAARHRRGPSQ